MGSIPSDHCHSMKTCQTLYEKFGNWKSSSQNYTAADHNAIWVSELFYTKSILKNFVIQGDPDKMKLLQNCCDMIDRAWKSVDAKIIQACWKKLFVDQWDWDDQLSLITQ